jgi:hypothetical protein
MARSRSKHAQADEDQAALEEARRDAEKAAAPAK